MGTRPKHESTGYRYGTWAGNERGHARKAMKCYAEISMPPGYLYRQCSRQNGHGYGGLYCKQHAKRYPAELDAPAV